MAAETQQAGQFPPFAGWMLWNLIRHEHVARGAEWPHAGIFEDQPVSVRAAWDRAADELQRRAKSLGRLI